MNAISDDPYFCDFFFFSDGNRVFLQGSFDGAIVAGFSGSLSIALIGFS
jgi:hypothetical protein